MHPCKGTVKIYYFLMGVPNPNNPGPIIGGVLGVLLLGAALIITVSAILCLIKKGMINLIVIY